MVAVRRLSKIVVLLLMVTAVTTILLTPSPSDDVPGVMHRNHSSIILALTIGLLQLASITKSNHLPQEISNHQLLPSNFLELLCQHLC
jgi:hypothetical protein